MTTNSPSHSFAPIVNSAAEWRAEMARLNKPGQPSFFHIRTQLPKPLDKHHKHNLDVVVDRLKVRVDARQRLAESFETGARKTPRKFWNWTKLPPLDKHHKHNLDVVVDRLKVRVDARQRLAESFETAGLNRQYKLAGLQTGHLFAVSHSF